MHEIAYCTVETPFNLENKRNVNVLSTSNISECPRVVEMLINQMVDGSVRCSDL